LPWVPGVYNSDLVENDSNNSSNHTITTAIDNFNYNNNNNNQEQIHNIEMPESAEIVALREHYESIMRREAYRYQQRIDALVQQLEEERKRNALLEAELVHHLRNQSTNNKNPVYQSTTPSNQYSLNAQFTTSPSVSPNSSASNYYPTGDGVVPDARGKANNVAANIIDARELKEKEGGRKYTAYVINLNDQRGEGWTIYKRYRQFEVLHCLLVRRFADDVPEFPPKHELISKSVKIPKRKAALQQYCNQVLSSPAYASYGPVVDFFKPERTDNAKTSPIHSPH